MAIHTRHESAEIARRKAPLTSAIRAGGICVAIGLATAWAFPFMQSFFGLGIVMAIVAMATHQVRAGLLLLAGAVAGAALCALVFLSGVLAILGGALSPASRPGSQQKTSFEVEPPRFVVPVAPAKIQAPAQALSNGPGSQETRTGVTHPLRLEDIRLMLRTGLGDTEIIAAVADRQLVEPVGPADAAGLRTLGAGDTLLSYLKGRQVSLDSSDKTLDRVAVAVSPPPMMTSLSTPPPAASAATPVDYATRDRRIENLKQQINELDEQIRTIRDNPKDHRYWWHYYGNGNNNVNQSALQKYLDQQRNVLRREKWRLEGR